MYRALAPWLRRLPPEGAHALGLWALRGLGALRRESRAAVPELATQVFGHVFANPVGLAAGFDKDGRALAGLAALGFGFLEVGTVTPRPQAGNPKPRLFRLARDRALINRMGFNNQGAAALVSRLAKRPPGVPVGVNIGKNRDTPLARAVDDYRLGFVTVAPVADYVTVNLSSPNTPQLRELQDPARARALLAALKEEQALIWRASGRLVPLAVKIAPDISPEALAGLLPVLREVGCDAVIATNTTLSRAGLRAAPDAVPEGGLSGEPLATRAREIIARVARALPEIPVIGVGGIHDVDSAWDHLVAGAALIQIYTGLVYEGPGLPGRIVRGLQARVRASGYADLACALQAARGNLSSAPGPNNAEIP